MRRNSIPTRGSDELSRDEFSSVRKRVIAADDQARILDVVAAMLGELFDVIGLVADGPAALAATLALKPDLVVLDISMPGMSGIEVAAELRKRGDPAKIVFLTVYEDAEILAKCLTTGGLGFVVKERMDSDLIPAMNEALAGRVFVSRFSSEAGAR
jgi:DNA-binding NarL/FixJ family response regulator